MTHQNDNIMGQNVNMNNMGFNNNNSENRKGGLQRQGTLTQAPGPGYPTGPGGQNLRGQQMMDPNMSMGGPSWQQPGGPVNGMTGQMDSLGSSKSC